MVERDRKLQIPAFVWEFVFSFRHRRKPNTRQFQTLLQLYCRQDHSPGGLYQWLIPTLAEYLRDLVDAELDRDEGTVTYHF